MTEKIAAEQEKEVAVKQLQHKARMQKLNDALDIAKRMRLISQVSLYEKEIKRIEKDWVINQQMPYPEVTPQNARDAFCEPHPVCAKHTTEGCKPCALRSLPTVQRYRWELFREHVLIGRDEQVMTTTQNDALNSAFRQAQMSSLQNVYNAFDPAMSMQLAQNALRGTTFTTIDNRVWLANTTAFQTPRETMYPLPALIELEKAIGRKIFDSFECWRPVSAQQLQELLDPWLVGIIKGDKERYFKLCDWR